MQYSRPIRHGIIAAPEPRNASMPSAEIRIANQLAEIGKVADLVDEFGRRHALSERVRHDMSIAIDEIISNIIHYSYRDNAGHGISVCLKLLPGELHAEIVDDGAAFDPLAHHTPQPSGTAKERALGGLGLHLVTSLMDNVRYVRRGDGNHLTLVKRTDGADSSGRRSEMLLSETTEMDVTIVTIGGRFDSSVAREIRERLSQRIASGVDRLLLDLHRLEYISSAGFWSLLVIEKEIEARGGSLALCGVDGEAKRLFELSGLAELFTICPSRDAGLAAMRASAR
jgi:anti-anti-sigma factor